MAKIVKIPAEVVMQAEKLIVEIVGMEAALKFPGAICTNPTEAEFANRVYQLTIDQHPLRAPLRLDEMDGRLYREDGKVIVEVLDEPWSLDFEDVTCLNPKAAKPDRIYQKIFTQKPIYFPDQYEKAMVKYIYCPNNFVISMNGYSKLDKERLLRYNLRHGEYEFSCVAVLMRTLHYLKDKFNILPALRIIDGASELGVDLANKKAAEEFGIIPLGFSCPRYLLYVKDDEFPVFVANNKDQYGDLYIKSLDFLIATGGRAHALEHDIKASCLYNKRIHFVDVLNILTGGGVPATMKNEDGDLFIENAAAAFDRNVSFFSHRMAVESSPRDGDVWDAVFANVSRVATEVYRRTMPPKYMFA